MSRRILTDLSMGGDLEINGLLVYSEIHSEISASVNYGNLKSGPDGYILIELGTNTVRIPYYSQL